MIEIKGLKINFCEQEVLRGIDWFITPSSRVGLVGPNGAGKTTLLRAIAGMCDYSGDISVPKSWRIGYLPQDIAEIKDMPLLELLRERAGLSGMSREIAECEREMSACQEGSPELKRAMSRHEYLQREFEAAGGYSFEVDARNVLRGLGFLPERDAVRRTSEFSGGWKMRIAIAALIFSRTDLMLLDEPTNHLDTESMEWLEHWLSTYKGTIITVSHDRRFLDKIVKSVAELSNGKLNTYSCGYEKYLSEREERRARIEAEREGQLERIEEIKSFIERFRYKPTKAKQVQSRIKMLEKLEITEAEAHTRTVKFKFPECPRSGREVVRVNDLAKSYGDNRVFSNFNFTVERGERVALVGVNGAGKSTLMRLINKTEQPSCGNVELGLNVSRAYFSQESAQNLDYSHTVWEEVCNVGSDLLEGARRDLLGAFLFSGNDINKAVSVLSGGEKSRLALLKMLLSPSNLLILDEPTNHLDYHTKELFQKALLEYGGTIIIVSHDRDFLDNLAGRVIEIRGGNFYDYRGNYSWFIEQRAKKLNEETVQKEQTKQHEKSEKPEAEIKTKEQKRLEAEERNRLYRARKEFADRLKIVEEEITAGEARKEEINDLLCRPEILSDSSKIQNLMIELNALNDTITGLYDEWEKLSETIEGIK